MLLQVSPRDTNPVTSYSEYQLREAKKDKNLINVLLLSTCQKSQIYHTLWDSLAKTKSSMTQPGNDDELNEHTFYICLWLADPTSLSKWLTLTVLQGIKKCHNKLLSVIQRWLQRKDLSEPVKHGFWWVWNYTVLQEKVKLYQEREESPLYA